MYAIDKIEGNLIIAENIETREKIEVDIKNFSFCPKEGIIFSIENEKIIERKDLEQKRRQMIREKMERLKRHE